MRHPNPLLDLAAFVLLVGAVEFVAFTTAQHDPQACAREDDQGRPDGLVACACYQAKDPCADGETTACAAYCNRKLCGCCQP